MTESILQFEFLPFLLNNPEAGWVLVILYLWFEIRTNWGRIAKVMNKIERLTTVVRGIARAVNGVNNERVDKMLADNGTEPSDIISERRQMREEIETVLKERELVDDVNEELAQSAEEGE